MIANYAKNVQEKEVELDPKCEVKNFADYKSFSIETAKYVQEACSLGLMGLNNDKETTIKNFNPNGLVTRAMFGTVLSRAIYGDANNGKNGANDLKKHLKALKKDGIMNNISNPNVLEKRGYAFIMFQRAANK